MSSVVHAVEKIIEDKRRSLNLSGLANNQNYNTTNVSSYLTQATAFPNQNASPNLNVNLPQQQLATPMSTNLPPLGTSSPHIGNSSLIFAQGSNIPAMQVPNQSVDPNQHTPPTQGVPSIPAQQGVQTSNANYNTAASSVSQYGEFDSFSIHSGSVHNPVVTGQPGHTPPVVPVTINPGVPGPSQPTTPVYVNYPGFPLNPNPVAPTGPASHVSSSTSNRFSSAKLDKLKLVEFDGTLDQWTNFWEVYAGHVYNTNMSDVNKFTYLRNCLTGSARRVVEGLALTSANFPKAIDSLFKRYNKPNLIVQEHVSKLLNQISTPTVKSDPLKYVEALWKYYDEINAGVRSLEGLGISGSLIQVFLCPIVLSKMPENIRLKWAEADATRQNNIYEMLNFLYTHISALEFSARSSKFGDPSKNQNSH